MNVSISYDDNHYTTGTSKHMMDLCWTKMFLERFDVHEQENNFKYQS